MAEVRDLLDQCIDAIQNVDFARHLPAMNDSFGTVRLDRLRVGGTQKLLELAELITARVNDDRSISLFYKLLQASKARALTCLHPILVRQCCHLRRYELALPLLSEPIESLPKTHHLSCQTHLEYHFYGALCYAALRDWQKSLNMLALVLCIGGQYASQIQLEAYRKYLLIALIEHGKAVPLPSTLWSNPKRALENVTAEYLDLADSFSHNLEKFHLLVEKHREELTTHGNGGLLNSVVASINARKIIGYQDVYSSLPLHLLGTKLGMTADQAGHLVSTLIKEKRISAVIKDDNVEFQRVTTNAAEQLVKLQADCHTIQVLQARMTGLQKMLEVDTDHVTKQVKESNGSHTDGKRRWNKSAYVEQGEFERSLP